MKNNNNIVRASEPVLVQPGPVEQRVLAEIVEADLATELAALADEWFDGRVPTGERVG